jgi:hypothetical protein
MTINHYCRFALTFALTLIAPSLFAGEIVLFDRENFQGGSVVFNDTVPNLADTGFNDQTASISVRDGTWEVCFDANFQGACTQLQPGDYPRLDQPFNRSISSLRQIGGVDSGGNYPAPAPSPEVSLGAGLPGASIGINLPSYPNLVPVPGYPVYYAPQVNSNYFFYDGLYWAYQRDSWYASSWYNGPWETVASGAVPLFVLRVPVRYYRQPPAYFRGWASDAPPRWGDHWGNAWQQQHSGWDNWNRSSVPAAAPLPVYQRQYSGNRYPRVEQQQVLQTQNYRYQPQDAVVQQHYQAQRVQSAPATQETRPQRQQGAAQQKAQQQQQQAASQQKAQEQQRQQGAAQQKAQQQQQQQAASQQKAQEQQRQQGAAQQRAQQQQQQQAASQQKVQQQQQQAASQQKAQQQQQQAASQQKAQQPQQAAAPREQKTQKQGPEKAEHQDGEQPR